MKRLLTLIAGIACSLQVVAATPKAVLEHYADLAQAKYADSLATAKALQAAVDRLIAEPTERNLAAAKAAWVAARHPCQQTEAYRFGNPIVDEWEGKMNAWPLDEGLIDYTAASYGSESDENPLYTANVIAHMMHTVGGRRVDAGRQGFFVSDGGGSVKYVDDAFGVADSRSFPGCRWDNHLLALPPRSIGA